MLPYMQRILRDKVHALHPKEELVQLAVRRPIDYQIHMREAEGRQEGVTCARLSSAASALPTLTGGVGREEVRTRGAEAAVRFMKTRAG